MWCVCYASIPRWPACLLSSPSRAAGYCERVTAENKSELLPFPLVDSKHGVLREAAEATRYYAAVESATLNGGPMPSPPLHLRPYSPPSEPEEEPGEGGGGEGGDGEVEGGVLAVAVGDAGGGEGGVLEGAPALAEGGDARNAAEHGADVSAHRAAYVASADDAAQLEGNLLSVQLNDEQLKRLCKANHVLCSTEAMPEGSCEIRMELLKRLKSVAKHGRPRPCPRCNSMLHVHLDSSWCPWTHNSRLYLSCKAWNGRKQCGYFKEVDMKDSSKLLPFRLVDSAERDLRMAAAQTRFDAARRLVGYEHGQSMSPPRLELRDGGENVVVE